jgi:acyl-CoA synthetase (AMP-forming)/AMP-acid ligase II
MQGLMMDYPLTLTSILERSRRLFGRKEIVTRGATRTHRYTYADFHVRVARLANVLRKLGVRPGERVATLGWNTYTHLEVYFAAPCSGAVLHTLNLRLAADQIGYIANHAEDSVVFVDQSLLPLLEQFHGQVPSLRRVVVMNEENETATSIPGALSYEQLLSEAPEEFDWPRLDENSAAAMCYTSGTTGNPKGALYSHRALFLHSMAQCLADTMALSESDVVLPVVPMFHANAWGLPFSSTMAGAKQVFPGPNLQPKSLAELIQAERVTIAAGVPTIWTGMLAVLEQGTYDVSSLRMCPCGGSAVPRSMLEGYRNKFGVAICQAWGMTEMSPLGTVSRLRSYMKDWTEDEQYRMLALQGGPVPGVEIRGVDEEGNEIPWDGHTLGELQVRGPWVIRSYYNEPSSSDRFMDGWFRTGDVVSIDEHGFIHIADRTKDLVKSGGEWISSVDLETTIMAHPQVLEAAVIAVPHPKWDERPLACVVPKPECQPPLTKQAILDFLATRVPRLWLPDDVVFIEAVPKTSVGKFDKKVLRVQFRDHLQPQKSGTR